MSERRAVVGDTPARGPVKAIGVGAALLVILATSISAGWSQSQDSADATDTASQLLQVPVVTLYPGDMPVPPEMANPVAGDPDAVQNGMDYFNQMNCVGCHAPNGAGGMGPALSNHKFIYGSAPANIYLSILQGRPNGMPAWGGLLSDEVIWDLVAYIESISQDPATGWGQTTSAKGFTIQQVPAEFVSTAEPWQHTSPFGYGKAPEQPKSSP